MRLIVTPEPRVNKAAARALAILGVFLVYQIVILLDTLVGHYIERFSSDDRRK